VLIKSVEELLLIVGEDTLSRLGVVIVDIDGSDKFEISCHYLQILYADSMSPFLNVSPSAKNLRGSKREGLHVHDEAARRCLNSNGSSASISAKLRREIS